MVNQLLIAGFSLGLGWLLCFVTMSMRERHIIELAKMRMVADSGESVSSFEQRNETEAIEQPEKFVGLEGINRAVKKSFGDEFEVM